MASRKMKDYFGLDYIVSLICTIILPIDWLFGIITRIMEGKIVAGIVRIPLGWAAWIGDIIFMLTEKHIWRLLDC